MTRTLPIKVAKKKMIACGASVLLFSACISARQTAPQSSLQSAQPQDDPPSRVGRMSYMQGSVSFQVQGDSDWVQADPNRPLTTGDNIWADKDSRAEVHINSTAIRLSSETGLSFLNVDDRTVQLQLPQGAIEVHLRQLSAGDAFEVDTPNLAFTLIRPGEYLISTDPNGSSTGITIREGEGQVTGGGDSWDLHSGESYAFTGTDQLAEAAQDMPAFDDFETWCQSRDQRENDSESAKYVSRDVDGYYDLDDYGDWDSTPDYGSVWYPRGVAVDWVPYHVGHWVFIAPWGWTWVDDEPWGFAPFHYGRWALVGTRWGWVPGPLVVRPAYAPALVGFVGGAGFGLSVSMGGGFTGMAWFPLGPRDVFVPAYRCSPRYVQVVNVTNTRVVNVVQVTNVYNTVVVNHDVARVNYTYAANVHAVTAVPRETFINARPVATAAVRINDAQFHDVHVVSAAAPTPVRASYVAANAKISTARPAVPFSQRPVVANLAPRAPIQTQRTVSNGPVRTLEEQGPSPTQANRGQNANSNNGFHSFGSSETQQTTPRSAQAGANTNTTNGFRPFTPQNGQSPNNAAPATGQANTNGNRNQTESNQQPYRFNPPVKAKDENYDVHPPLNSYKDADSSQPKQQPRQETTRGSKQSKPAAKPH